jgi:hypothetical protein
LSQQLNKPTHLSHTKNLNRRTLIASPAEYSEIFRIGTATESFRMDMIDFEREGGSAVLARTTVSGEHISASLRGRRLFHG